MAINPTIAGAPQLAPIPIPQRSNAALDGAEVLGNAVTGAADLARRTDAAVLASDREIAVRQEMERQATEASAGQVSVLNALGSAREALQASRDDPGTTLDTHATLVKDTAATLRQSMLSAFPTERVRRQFAPQIERDVQTLIAGEDGWQRGQQAKMQGHAGDAVMNTATSNIFANPTSTTFEAEHKRALTFFDTVPMDAATRATVLREVDAKTLRAMSDGLIAQGRFADAKTLAASPQFGAIFGADGVKLTLAQADRGEAEQQAGAAAQVAAGKKTASEHLDAVSAIIEQGGIVSEGDVRATAQAAQAAGVEPAKIIKFQGLGVTQAINQQFGPAADQDGSKTRAALSQLNEVANQRPLTSDEAVRRDRLGKLVGVRRDDTASLLKPMLGTVQGDLQALGKLDAINVDDREKVADRMRPGLSAFALVRGPARAAAVEGYYELGKSRDIIKEVLPNGKLGDTFKTHFENYLGPMTPQINGQARAAYQGVAEAIYAKLLKNAQATGWHADLFARAANMAMGAELRDDGNWYGGMGLINGHHAMLPDWSTAAALETKFARADYSDARYSDGKPADKVDIVTHYTPVLIDGGGHGEKAYYNFVGPTGRLKNARGGNFVAIALPDPH